MDAEAISNLIRQQITSCETLPNSHGIDIERCLTKPTLIKVIHRRVLNGRIDDSLETVWLVLVESAADGYKIVFNEDRGSFGLVSGGFANDPHPVLCGYYGDFPNVIANM